MAVASGSVQKEGKLKSPMKKKEGSSSAPKRNSNPGIRLVGARIYDPVNGKTCHQCRQKTRDYAAGCKSSRNNKPCTLYICHKCLLNRYGEKAEEVSLLEDWKCPRCRGICNCSFCMKRRGCQPTGQLVHTAKATGFSSVSDMLQTNGIDNVEQVKVLKDAKKINTLNNGKNIVAAESEGKENSIEAAIGLNIQPSHLPKSPNDKKSAGCKRKDVNGKPEDGKCSLMVDSLAGKEKSKKIKREGLTSTSKEAKKHKGLIKDQPKESQLDNNKEMKHQPKKSKLDKGEGTVSAESKGKENSIEAAIGSNIQPSHLPKSPNDKKSAGCKRKDVNLKPEDGKRLLLVKNLVGKEKSKKIQLERSTSLNKEVKKLKGLIKDQLKESQLDNSKEMKVQPKESKLDNKKKMKDQLKVSKLDNKKNAVASLGEAQRVAISEKSQDFMVNKEKKSSKEGYVKVSVIENNDPFDLTSLPRGMDLTAVSGIDLQSEDVGNALQFLEFCRAFGKILDITKGQPEAVLKDIMHGRISRRGKCTLTVQFLDKLISFLTEEDEERFSSTKGKNAWYDHLKTCISESTSVAKIMGLDSLSEGAEGFENLSFSKKLMVLNFICDQLLETVKIRDWIDDQNAKFAEKAKEAKQKVTAAKDEEKRLKQQMKDKVAQAIIAKNGAPLSISEHEAIVSQIKHEAAEAHAAVMESRETCSKYKQKSEVVRVEPVFLGADGHVYWRLKCFSDKSVLLCQEIGAGDNAALNEKWSALDVEQKEIAERRINFLSCRVKRVKAHKVPEMLPSQNIEVTS